MKKEEVKKEEIKKEEIFKTISVAGNPQQSFEIEEVFLIPLRACNYNPQCDCSAY
jgi:hypothetical protein